MFIVFEWGEWAGKTTQIKNLTKYFEQKWKKVITTREPWWNWSKIAEDIRKILKSPENSSMSHKTELFLFLASRAQHIQEVILPKLEEWYIVISDRFSFSTIAYQHFWRNLFEYDFIKSLNNIATTWITPDATIFFDIDPEKWINRIKDWRQIQDCRLDQEKLEFHKKVRDWFLQISEKEENFYSVDAEKKEAEVFEQVLQIINKKLNI